MKTNLQSTFGTNKNLERDGVDFVVKPADPASGAPEVVFRLRRFYPGNPRVKAAMAQYYKPYARQIEMDTLPQEKSDELSMRLFIDVCLVSWSGVMNETGAPIECNKDNALALFKSLPELFATLQKHASDFESYKEELGNS
jgi:hypothetical protein